MFIEMNLQGKRGEFKRQTEDPGDELHVEVLNKEPPRGGGRGKAR